MVIHTSDQVAKLCAFNKPPFPINFCCTMCAVPVIDNAAAAANAASHANIVKEIENTEEHINKKNQASLFQQRISGDLPGSILLRPKQTRVVEFTKSTNKRCTSIPSIGSKIDPFTNTTKADAGKFSITNIPDSALVHASTESRLCVITVSAIYCLRVITCHGMHF
jgi:hypothetical protein